MRQQIGLGGAVTDDEITAALSALGDGASRIPARSWPGVVAGLDHPGLYTWWVNSIGAEMLSTGLGAELGAGRIYGGQAGATAWPSGTKRLATLRSRIGGNHIGGSVRGSTFRLTLAAVLRARIELEVVGPRKLEAECERRLTEWIKAHLDVAIHAFPDADRLGGLERLVLGSLDPPLNLDGMPRTPLRARLSALRREIAAVTTISDIGGGRMAPVVVVGSPAQEPHARGALREQVTLHDEIADILRSRGNQWTTTKEVAAEVNRRGRYQKQDGGEVTAFQVNGRTTNYAHLFERDGQRVRLRE